jgi:hypothetical protein
MEIAGQTVSQRTHWQQHEANPPDSLKAAGGAPDNVLPLGGIGAGGDSRPARLTGVFSTAR